MKQPDKSFDYREMQIVLIIPFYHLNADSATSSRPMLGTLVKVRSVALEDVDDNTLDANMVMILTVAAVLCYQSVI
jgi:hypothetical protein